MARLTPITSKDQVPSKDHAIVDAIVGSRGALQGPFSMFLYCPEFAGRAAHLGSTYVPADDSCFCRFEAETDNDVRDANEIAGVPFARIVAAEEIGIDEPEATERGER